MLVGCLHKVEGEICDPVHQIGLCFAVFVNYVDHAVNQLEMYQLGYIVSWFLYQISQDTQAVGWERYVRYYFFVQPYFNQDLVVLGCSNSHNLSIAKFFKGRELIVSDESKSYMIFVIPLESLLQELWEHVAIE